MTNDEVLQGNKLIANFLGISVQEVRLSKDLTLLAYGEEGEMPDWVNIQYFQPNADWNELMLSLEKIWNITGTRSLFYFSLEELEPDLKIPWFYNPKHIVENQFNSTIEEVYSLVVSFIEYYNDKFKS